MSNIPNDPMMLLSYVNTNLRDYYPSLEELCSSKDININELTSKLESIDYFYDKSLNKFV